MGKGKGYQGMSSHLKPQTLIVAIQCVASEARSIERQLEEVDADDAADLEQLLLSFDLAIDDLKSAYAKTCEQYGGLPSYEELVNRV